MNQTAQIISAAPAAAGEPTSIGGLLLEAGKITPENAERVLRLQKELGIRFGEAAVRLGLITEADIQQVLARQFDYPYLQAGDKAYSPHLVAAYQPFSPQVETLRAVRSQLMLRWFARGHKSLAVAAAAQGDGTSLLAANLAVVFSQLGERTLLVDGNMRAPSQHTVFNLKNRQGLSDVLAGRAGLDVIQKVDAFVDLSVLTAGTQPPNPQELLNRSAFVELERQLGSAFDIVLYDTAAFADSFDAAAIAARAGGALLVVRQHKTLVGDIDTMAEKLKQNGAQVVGSVLVDF
ncbi:chain length determinant protein tyrosine kinase EpsG [Massilia sp. YIM B04103]|uniref:chain length determinant protein tyrosine kinase EpsG n=1 Tax=Massilia sp. YIM B04103 TaxID=2963106 RepID=UPI00210DB91F|nr:chain length determinant protein tyrosine kinase EpsG [Massilia sp. YIM B04103]